MAKMISAAFPYREFFGLGGRNPAFIVEISVFQGLPCSSSIGFHVLMQVIMGYLADTCSESKKDGRRGLYCMKATRNNRFGGLPIEKM